jgi:hypothetical protein
MKTQEYSKEKEIALIEKLANMDGYFAQFLAEHLGSSAEQIAENINNDYPLEFGSTTDEHTGKLKAELREREIQHVESLLCLLPHVDDRGEKDIINMVGRLRVIQAKRAYSMELTTDDIDYLMKEAQKPR